MFRLLILGCLSDGHGRLWRRNTSHLVAVELLLPQKQPNQVEPPSSSSIHYLKHRLMSENVTLLKRNYASWSEIGRFFVILVLLCTYFLGNGEVFSLEALRGVSIAPPQ